jgi:hypothetical protein
VESASANGGAFETLVIQGCPYLTFIEKGAQSGAPFNIINKFAAGTA